MTTVYVNEEIVRVDMCCGVSLVERCSVQKWAPANNIDYKKTRKLLGHRKIFLKTEETRQKELAQKIQTLCDNCDCGEMSHARSKTR